MFIYATTGVVFTAVVGGAFLCGDGLPSRFPAKIQELDKVKAESIPSNRITEEITLHDVRSGNLPVLGAGGNKPSRLLVWGDSHALSILPAVIKVAESNKENIVTVWFSGSAPVLNYIPPSPFSLREDNLEVGREIIESVRLHEISNVLLAAKWSGYFNHEVEQTKLGNLIDADFGFKLKHTIEVLNSLGCKVWVLREVPNHRVSVPKALASNILFNVDVNPYRCTVRDLMSQNVNFDRALEGINDNEVNVIDVSALMLEDSGESYRMSFGNRALYYDEHHLTKDGA